MLRRGGAGVHAKVRQFEFFLHFLARGGTRYILGWGGAAPAPYTPTLFKTKIADFPTLF